MSVSVLAPVLLGGAVGAGLLLVVLGVRGTVNDPSRPPSPAARLITALRRPAMARRVAAGVVVGLLVLVVTGWPVAALGLGALMALWPRLFGGSAAEARQIAELEALVVWVESLKDTMKPSLTRMRAASSVCSLSGKSVVWSPITSSLIHSVLRASRASRAVRTASSAE